MKYHFLGLFLLMQNCQFAHESSPAPDAAGDDFRTRLAKGKDVYVQNQQIDAELDFTTLLPAQVLTPGARRVFIAGAVTFYKCRFKKKVSAYRTDKDGVTTAAAFAKNLSFVNCTFDDEVNFRACSVQDLACFANCTFVKNAVFEESDFAHYAVFTEAHFLGDTRFQNAFFRKKADFLRTEFNQPVNFQGAAFTLDAQFGAIKSYTYTDFSLAQFNGHAFFNYAECYGRATFDDAWFKGRCDFIKVKLVTASMRNCWFFGKPRFDELNIDISLDMENSHWPGEKPDWEGVERRKLKNYRGE